MNPTQTEIEERMKEFFAQDVSTAPMEPGEYQQPESNTLTAVIEPTMQDQEDFQNMMNQESQPISPTKRKLTITYSRTLQVAAYEPSMVSATMEAELPDNCTLDEAMKVYENEMMLVKGAVLQQHNLPFKLSENERVIEEVFGDTTLVSSLPVPPSAAAPAPAGLPAPSQAGFNPPAAAAAPQAAGAVMRNKTPSAADQPYWDMLVANPSAFWDNRADKTNPAAPDFKLKVDRNASPEEKKDAKALWLNACPDQYCAQFGVQL
jgi:hypothetical protein